MLRTSLVVPLLRKCTARFSLKAEPNSKLVSSQRKHRQRTAAAASQTEVQSKSKKSVAFLNRADHPESSSEKLPTLGELMLQSVRQAPVFLTPLRRIVEAFSACSDEEEKSKHLLKILDLLGSITKTYNRVDYIQMLNLVWPVKEPLRINIFHYNAYLKARVRAGLEVDVETSLKEIEQYGLTPDGITNLRFVENFCEHGQVDRALEIVSKMRAGQKTRDVHHALIKGYLRSGDPDGARQTLARMRAEQVCPNSETYTVLASGLAECGGHAEVLEVIDGGDLSPSQLISVLQSSSDRDLIEKLCALISESDWSMDTVKKCCVELIHAGKLEEARLIVDKLIISDPRMEEQQLDFFSAQMVVSEYPATEVLEFCRSIRCEQRRYKAIRAAAKKAVSLSDSLPALDYLSAFRSEGFPIREHYFYPLICRARNESEALSILRRMDAWELPASEIVLSFLYSRLIDDWNFGALTALSRVDSLNISESLAKQAMAHYYVSHRTFSDCIEVLDLFEASIWGKLAPLIARLTTPVNQASSLLLIQKISNRVRDPSDVLQEYERHLPQEGAATISAKLRNPVDLTYSQPPNTWLRSRHCNTMREMTRLTFLCSKDNPDEIREHLATLNEDDLDPSALFSLINFYLRARDLKRALYYFERVREDPEVEIGDWMVLGVITLMIERGKYNEALDLIRQHHFRRNFKSPSSKSSKMSAVAKSAIERVGLDGALKIVSELAPKCAPIDSNCLLPIMNHVLKHEPARVLDVFIELERRHRVTPGLLQLYRHFISEGKMSDLKIAHNLAARRHDRAAADMFLARAYILERKIPKARELLKKVPVDSARSFQWKTWCEALLRKNLISDLEVAVELASESGFESEPLYLILAEAYARDNDVDKAKRLWLNSRNKKVNLSDRALQRIKGIFEAAGKKPPLTIDE